MIPRERISCVRLFFLVHCLCGSFLVTMKTQDAIIAWNNEAVFLLEKGNFCRGLALLRTANRHLVQCMNEEQIATTVRGGMSSFPDSHSASEMVSYDCTSELRRTRAIGYPIQQQGIIRTKEASAGTVRCSRNPSNEAIDSKEDKSYIYQRFIRIIRTPVDRGNYILSFIILFNIALAYQLQVLQWDHERHPLQTQQRRLRLCHESFIAYRCAFTMKNHGRIRLDTMILLALTNNMCHLSVALRMMEQADHLRELLTIALVMTNGDDASNSVISLDGFWKTALTKTDGQWNAVPETAVAA